MYVQVDEVSLDWWVGLVGFCHGGVIIAFRSHSRKNTRMLRTVIFIFSYTTQITKLAYGSNSRNLLFQIIKNIHFSTIVFFRECSLYLETNLRNAFLEGVLQTKKHGPWAVFEEVLDAIRPYPHFGDTTRTFSESVR